MSYVEGGFVFDSVCFDYEEFDAGHLLLTNFKILVAKAWVESEYAMKAWTEEVMPTKHWIEGN